MVRPTQKPGQKNHGFDQRKNGSLGKEQRLRDSCKAPHYTKLAAGNSYTKREEVTPSQPGEWVTSLERLKSPEGREHVTHGKRVAKNEPTFS